MADEKKPDYYTGPQAGDLRPPRALRAVRGVVRGGPGAGAQRPRRVRARHCRRRGLPNVRMVLLKGSTRPVTRRAASCSTPISRAPRARAAGLPQGGVVFHWKSLRRQVRVRGPVSMVSDAEADAYFASRPRGSRIGAWASQQSRPLEGRFALEKAVAGYRQASRRRHPAAAVLVGLPRHAARDRVLARPAVPAARPRRLPARRGQRGLEQTASLSVVIGLALRLQQEE